jgi:hypothetical protein
MSIHAHTRSFESGPGQIGAVPENSPDPFLVHGVGPLGAVEISDGQLQEKIAQRRWVQNGGVEEGRETAQDSVSHLEVLSLCSELIETYETDGMTAKSLKHKSYQYIDMR